MLMYGMELMQDLHVAILCLQVLLFCNLEVLLFLAGN